MASEISRLPLGAKALVSLTYDDALMSHVDNAGPALERHGLLGTFFLADRLGERRANPEPWRNLRKAGHEFAAHTLNHPCPHADRWQVPGIRMADYDEARMKADLEENIRMLRNFGEERRQLSFAYPCGVTWLGPEGKSYIPLVRSMFIACRGVGRGFEDPAKPNLEQSVCIDGAGKSTAELIESAQMAEREGKWAIYMFHGVGDEHLSLTAEAHEGFVKYLAGRRGDIATLPYGDAAGLLGAR